MKLQSLVLTSLLVAASPALAQGPFVPLAQAPGATKALVPLEIEVVITRYDGTKKLSSLPYTLAVNANGREVQLNMGTQVAVPTTTFTPVAAGGAASQPLRSYTYRDVGTRIQSGARSTEDGRFDLELNIDDSSVYQSPNSSIGGEAPAFRNFSARNTLLLRDGQTREYTAATDRVSGEVVKISVTLRIVK